MDKPFTKKENNQRVCVEVDLKGITYPKYIFTVLLECGFSYENHKEAIRFVHNQDTDLSIMMTIDKNHNWHHLIAYRHSKWTLTYEGDVRYHVFGNDVLKIIRRAYDHWHGL